MLREIGECASGIVDVELDQIELDYPILHNFESVGIPTIPTLRQYVDVVGLVNSSSYKP